MRKILILGASSAIARGIALSFAQSGDELFLAGRHIDDLTRTANDLHIRFNIACYVGYFDVLKYETHSDFLKDVIDKMSGLDGIVAAFGYLTNPKSAAEFAECKKIIDSNFTGAVSIINLVVDYYLEQKKQGFIIGISSVAGDRGRAENYIYGAAKAALSIYLQGLRQRLCAHNIRVITIKPGYIDTPMVYGRADVFFAADPNKVGAAIAKSLNKPWDVVYVPWFWRIPMLIIKLIPEFLYKRLEKLLPKAKKDSF